MKNQTAKKDCKWKGESIEYSACGIGRVTGRSIFEETGVKAHVSLYPMVSEILTIGSSGIAGSHTIQASPEMVFPWFRQIGQGPGIEQGMFRVIEGLLVQLKTRCSILMVSHNPYQVQRIADNAFELQNGRMNPFR